MRAILRKHFGGPDIIVQNRHASFASKIFRKPTASWSRMKPKEKWSWFCDRWSDNRFLHTEGWSKCSKQ